MAPIYRIRGVSHAYNGRTVLDIDDMEIPAGGIVGIIGPNGSGKSTLLKLLAFVEKASSGEIRFQGVPAGPFSASVRFRVTLLTQEPYLLKRSVFHNIAYGLRLRGARGNVAGRVAEALEWVGLTAGSFVHRRWFELSGGEAQRVALAARLVLKPEVLLMDEPTASVDAASAQLIKDAALRARRKWGTTLIVASHDWPWLHEICDQVRHLFRGCFFGDGEENIVFGPFRPADGGLWCKRLGDQELLVPEPPGPGAAAVIPNRALRIRAAAPGSVEGPRLRGVVSRLVHEKRSGGIVVTVLVENLPVTAKISREQLRRRDLYPGGEVTVSYDPRLVRWSR